MTGFSIVGTTTSSMPPSGSRASASTVTGMAGAAAIVAQALGFGSALAAQIARRRAPVVRGFVYFLSATKNVGDPDTPSSALRSNEAPASAAPLAWMQLSMAL